MQKCTSLKLIHYADDSTALAEDDNPINLSLIVNNELEKIDEWTRANKLSLNIDKTYFSLITTKTIRSIPDIIIRNQIISRSKSQKFLGIFVDERLTFKDQINKICKKVSSGIGILKKLKSFIAPEILLKIYNAIILPHIIYAVEAWGASSKVGIKRLNNLINKAKRFVDSNAILSLDKIHERFCLIKLFKYFIRKDSNYFYQKFVSNIPNHSIRTRSNVNNLFTNPRIVSSKYKSSFFYKSCKYWNKLPNNIRNIKKVAKFKRMLKNRS